MKKTEAQKLAYQIAKVFAALGKLSRRDQQEAFELAAQMLDLSGLPTGVAYADACQALAKRLWLGELTGPKLYEAFNANGDRAKVTIPED